MTLESTAIVSLILASFYFILKYFIVDLLSIKFSDSDSSSRLQNIFTAWLVVQSVQSLIIFCLSIFNSLTAPIYLIIITLASLYLFFNYGLKNYFSKLFIFNLPKNLFLFTILFIVLIFWIRSSLLFDLTWDAQTYEIPRISIWLNAKSVFVHDLTPQLNLFSNEWNAEINSIAYCLFSGSFFGMSLANVEVLIILFVGIYWVLSLLGVPSFFAFMGSSILGSAPAILGLAATLKGDLLAIAGFVVAFALFLQVVKTFSISGILFFILFIVYGVGGKIPVVFPSFALVLALILIKRADLKLKKFLSFKGIHLFIGSLLILSLRFWLNLFIYGNPIKRVDSENPQFELSNLLFHLKLFFSRTFDMTRDLDLNERMWSLSATMGSGAGVVLLALICSFLLMSRRFKDSENENVFISNKLLVLVALGIFIMTLIPMSLYEHKLWSFRYFAATAVILLLVFSKYVFTKKYNQKFKFVVSFIALVGIALNLKVVFLKQGEVIPATSWKELSEKISTTNTFIKRMCIYVGHGCSQAGVDILNLDTNKKLNILLFQGIDSAIVPFIGSHSQNYIKSVASKKELVAKSIDSRWDVIVVGDRHQAKDKELELLLEKNNYTVLTNNGIYIIALPRERVQLTNFDALTEISWSSYGYEKDIPIEYLGKFPMIQSIENVDKGYITQEFTFDKPLLVKASFTGNIHGPDHGGHLSLHERVPMFILKNGKYDTEDVFLGFTPNPEQRRIARISFGLGGWGVGAGQLSLSNLEIYTLEVKN